MTKKEKEKLLKKIKIAMAESGTTQTDLAKKLGLTQAAVSAWFKGKGTPGIDTITRVADVLNKPVNYFFAEVKGNGNAIGNGASVNPAVEKDIALIMAKIQALESKIENLELKYNLLKKGK